MSVEPYDVLQVSYAGGPWMDYSTLRTPSEINVAISLCDNPTDDGKQWRIVNLRGDIKYPKGAP